MTKSLITSGADRGNPMARSWNRLTGLWGNRIGRKASPVPAQERFLDVGRWPTLDLSENDKEVLIRLEAPGLTGKDLEISYAEGALLIKGEKKEDREEQRRHVYYRESRHGAFMRSVPIDANVDWNKARAEFKRGVLKVALPKKSGKAGTKEIPVT
jgi:HSP20 family molecular chaperone IbpA